MDRGRRTAMPRARVLGRASEAEPPARRRDEVLAVAVDRLAAVPEFLGELGRDGEAVPILGVDAHRLAVGRDAQLVATRETGRAVRGSFLQREGPRRVLVGALDANEAGA